MRSAPTMPIGLAIAVLIVSLAPTHANAQSTKAAKIIQAAAPEEPWWKHAVIYEVYPRSFADSNGDGTGDLNGITAHLDYLKDLGVDAIWLTPFYPSPQVDFGYDISDYRNVDPRYGTLAEFDRMAAEAKKRNIRVLIDLVVNHTSDQHPWFTESRSSKTDPKAAWYVWHDGKPGSQPPNNWTSSFGGSAWQWVPERSQYYFHHYYVEQPDLNWRNPAVREAVSDILRFWLKRGVSGFRLDGIGNLYEDAALRDEPALGGVNALGDPNLSHIYTRNLPETHDAYRMLRKVADEFPDTVLVGQVGAANAAELATAYGARNDELQLPINAQFGSAGRLLAAEFRQKLKDAEIALNGNPPLLVLDSHDRTRSWTRYSDGVHDLAIAKLLATLLLAPRGAALIYYGQELGMENNDPKRKEDVQDPVGRRGWPANKGRDGERTPMQWDSGANAGFSSGKTTWLPLAPGYTERNVASETAAPDSLLNYYKALIRLRKQNASLREGEFEAVDESGPDAVAWISKSRGEAAVIALNFSASPRTVTINAGTHGLSTTQATTLLSSFSAAGTSVQVEKLTLPPYGAFVGRIK
jgi:alpha-glucosidase